MIIYGEIIAKCRDDEDFKKKFVAAPEGVEVCIVQNTDDVRNLILPASPKTLTAAELKAISSGDVPVVMPSASINVVATVTTVVNQMNTIVVII